MLVNRRVCNGYIKSIDIGMGDSKGKDIKEQVRTQEAP
jgi:hypothetical protein